MKEQPTPKEPTRTRNHLHIEEEESERRLVNTSLIDVVRLVYSTAATLFDFPNEGDVLMTSRPYYEIRDLPSGAAVTLEKIDRTEGGFIGFSIEEVEWADGLEEKEVSIVSSSQVLRGLSGDDREALLGEKVPVTRHLERERETLRTVESHFLQRGEEEES